MKVLPLLISILFIQANQISSNEPIKIEKRQVDTYKGISVAGSYRVRLIKGKEGEITLNGSESDLDNTEIKIKNDILIIKNKESSWFRSWKMGVVEITIPVEEISKLSMSGSGSIYSEFLLQADDFKTIVTGSGKIKTALNSDEFDGLITGSGSIKAWGETHSSNIKITGSGDFNGNELNAVNTKVIITGSGDASVHAEEALNVIITGSGSVKYSGKPDKQISKVSGSGKVSVYR